MAKRSAAAKHLTLSLSKLTMRTGIYAILDVTADMFVGGLHLHYAEAAAIRMFSDIAALPDTTVGRHPDEYELHCLGILTEDKTIEGHTKPFVVLTGKQWVAVNGPKVGEAHHPGKPLEVCK